MKKILAFFTLWLCAVLAMAGTVSEEEALQQALSFVRSQKGFAVQGKMRLASRVATTLSLGTTTDQLYVFNYGEDEGFVVVSADDRLCPVLGYTEKGSYDEAQVPDNLREWMEECAAVVAQMDALCVQTPYALQAAQASRKAIAPLLSTKWAQDDPYSALCPFDSTAVVTATERGCHSLVGCSAVALAQVMNYYGYPKQTLQAMPGYTSLMKQLKVPAIGKTAIDWASMADVYTGSETDQQKKAVALLMELCAVAIHTDFSGNGSSAVIDSVYDAMTKYFDYDAGRRLVERYGHSNAEWDSIIYGELSQKRPVIYRGTRDRSGADSGHAFVVDGYQNGYYHVNWGWSGNYNGFFLLLTLSPYSTYEADHQYNNEGYCLNHAAIVGIRPHADGKPEAPRMTTNSIVLTGEGTLTRASADEDFPAVQLTFGTFNTTDAARTFDMGVALIDQQDKILATKVCQSNRKLDVSRGYSALKCEMAFGKGLADGTYRLVAVSRECTEGSAWLINNKALEYYHLYAVVKGNTLRVYPKKVSLSGQMAVEGKNEVGSLTKLKVTVKNLGTEFHNYVYLFVDNLRRGARYLDLEEGGSGDMLIGFTPTMAGQHTLTLAYYDNDYVHFDTLKVTTVAAATNTVKLELAQNNGQNGKVGTTLRLKVKATNQGSANYDNKLRALLYRVIDDKGTGMQADLQETEVLIEPTKAATHEFVFADLMPGEEYFAWIYYYSGGKQCTNKQRLYGGRYQVDATLGVKGATTTAGTVPVYTIDGRYVGHTERSAAGRLPGGLPKGVYVVGNKKVAR